MGSVTVDARGQSHAVSTHLQQLASPPRKSGSLRSFLLFFGSCSKRDRCKRRVVEHIGRHLGQLCEFETCIQ
ncbi:BZ3500_MvSof-1268-A1-R1_Chr2-1g04512 [Microbotryum saponariae]|uniref:BZ3500_MvSof-1268-A1-R1_Chr2-1g04512 protein n=1 Tax=Microbotryum saponariae TaxID=289078 RepID=A0A2X0KL83_9BASI|nr:BZ3500_MvSof-1268-A1-R1_Chr2-1g04512 [Microbotryum saponariae]SCZ91886.1 BZ3501_MvSof-1269-A2-R1_Chr2-1g04168 [Microbotryum saponariae]